MSTPIVPKAPVGLASRADKTLRHLSRDQNTWTKVRRIASVEASTMAEEPITNADHIDMGQTTLLQSGLEQLGLVGALQRLANLGQHLQDTFHTVAVPDVTGSHEI
jgi:hypothetical protein